MRTKGVVCRSIHTHTSAMVVVMLSVLLGGCQHMHKFLTQRTTITTPLSSITTPQFHHTSHASVPSQHHSSITTPRFHHTTHNQHNAQPSQHLSSIIIIIYYYYYLLLQLVNTTHRSPTPSAISPPTLWCTTFFCDQSGKKEEQCREGCSQQGAGG